METPGFVPVATNAAIKSVDHKCVSSGLLSYDFVLISGIQLMFCNTYHLILHPGSHVIRNAGNTNHFITNLAPGGLHKFMNFKTPLITDSGGFQVC